MTRMAKPTHPAWIAMDELIEEKLLGRDPVLEGALVAAELAGLPSIQVSAAQGKLLYLLARMAGVRRVLEIGTLGGYSTLWLARALPAEGRVVTLEVEPRHAAVARENFVRAGLSDKIELRVGAALELLPVLAAQKGPPFDLTFLDADKQHNADYLKWAIELSRPGSIIVIDNVVREGAVADETNEDERVRGTRRVYELLASERRVSATALQTVGVKGYDGFILAVVNP